MLADAHAAAAAAASCSKLIYCCNTCIACCPAHRHSWSVGAAPGFAAAGADVEMAAWTGWTVLGQRLKEQCSSCRDSSSSRKSISDALAGATIDAARVADTPGPDPASTRGRTARQYNPQREAALKPGGAAEPLHLQHLGLAAPCVSSWPQA